MKINDPPIGISICITLPRRTLNVALYPFSWSFHYTNISDPIELRLVQIGPFAVFVTSIPDVIIKG